MTIAAQNRAFPVFRQGELREALLSAFRSGLRRLVNPETGTTFTESEIAAATANATRWYAEANAIDLVLLAGQQRALFLADQVRPERAASAWLRDFHGALLEETHLPAAGGTGLVEFTAPAGTIWVGSTTKPDVAAMYGKDEAGLRYQVLFSETSTSSTIQLTLSGIDTGLATNLAAGKKITLANAPLSANPLGTVVERFTGGSPKESDADFARRLLALIRYKQGAGNNPQLRAWARKASSSVDDAFVYACALHAGSVVIGVTQKRGNVQGPGARIANAGTLSSVSIALTPPASGLVPAPPYVLPLACVPQYADMRVFASLPRAKRTGWRDAEPWPSPALGGSAVITTLTSQTEFQITTTGPKPSSSTPSLMAINFGTTRFERLAVLSVTEASAGVYDVELSAAPSTITLQASDWISPDTERRVVIARAIEGYFDSLGPGEVVDLATDMRAHRALRFPLPAEERPTDAGSAVSVYLQEALGAALSGAVYEFGSTAPSVPSDPTVGPSLMVARRIGLYPPPL